jgi:hypothetical protein
MRRAHKGSGQRSLDFHIVAEMAGAAQQRVILDPAGRSRGVIGTNRGHYVHRALRRQGGIQLLLTI